MRLSYAFIVIAAALAAALPAFGSSYQIYLAELIMINIVAAIGLNLLTGNCGQISLCHASLMAIGAYTTALLTTRFTTSYALALPAGVIVTTLLGASLGYPARRLSGLYLALVTLGFLEVVSIVIEEFPDLTGGVRGLKLVKPELAGWPLNTGALYYFVLAVTALAIRVGWRLQHSRYGRAFDAVRQSVIVAQALAIPPGRTKLLAFSIAAAFAGLAGGLVHCRRRLHRSDRIRYLGFAAANHVHRRRRSRLGVGIGDRRAGIDAAAGNFARREGIQ